MEEELIQVAVQDDVLSGTDAVYMKSTRRIAHGL